MKIGGEKMRTASGQKGENEHRPIDFFFCCSCCRRRRRLALHDFIFLFE